MRRDFSQENEDYKNGMAWWLGRGSPVPATEIGALLRTRSELKQQIERLKHEADWNRDERRRLTEEIGKRDRELAEYLRPKDDCTRGGDGPGCGGGIPPSYDSQRVYGGEW